MFIWAWSCLIKKECKNLKKIDSIFKANSEGWLSLYLHKLNALFDIFYPPTVPCVEILQVDYFGKFLLACPLKLSPVGPHQFLM